VKDVEIFAQERNTLKGINSAFASSDIVFCTQFFYFCLFLELLLFCLELKLLCTEMAT
jgi:hypothetical protein